MWKIAVTGHRPNKLFGYNLYNNGWIKIGKIFRKLILDRLEKYARVELIIGMALGVDQVFGLVGVKLKNQGFPVVIHAAIPCIDQPNMWKSREYWDKIKNNSDIVNYVTEKRYIDDKSCLEKRNRYMVDLCDELFAVCDGSKSGTLNCINYAIRKNKPILNIYDQLYAKK